MAQLPLTQGAYVARSIIANAQRCYNLFPESNTPDAPFPFTFYQRPGLRALSQAPNMGRARGLYTASRGDLFAAFSNMLYWIDSGWTFHSICEISDTLSPVTMIDNGGSLIVATGEPDVGYLIDIPTKLVQDLPENFLGATGAGYVDGFLVFSQPQSKNFYSSLLNVIEFDAFYIAAKTGRPDLLQTLIIVHREIWLIGTKTTEVWFNAGAPQFPFAEQQGVFIEHGTIAPYSVMSHGLVVFFISQDKDGRAIVVMITAYEAKRVSTYAIETEFSKYSRLDDAVGQIYQMEGHVYYILHFPTADKTWVFDMMEGLWHEEGWNDADGNEHRSRACSIAYAYGRHVAADWQNGILYDMSLDIYDDNRAPIVCRRGFPHLNKDSRRVSYSGFIAEMQVGTILGGVQYVDEFAFSNGFSSGFDIREPDTLYVDDPKISLRYSDDRGASWSNPIEQTIGATGKYLTSIQFNRLGMARDRVFELFWALPCKTALNGANIDVVPFGS